MYCICRFIANFKIVESFVSPNFVSLMNKINLNLQWNLDLTIVNRKGRRGSEGRVTCPNKFLFSAT